MESTLSSLIIQRQKKKKSRHSNVKKKSEKSSNVHGLETCQLRDIGHGFKHSGF